MTLEAFSPVPKLFMWYILTITCRRLYAGMFWMWKLRFINRLASKTSASLVELTISNLTKSCWYCVTLYIYAWKVFGLGKKKKKKEVSQMFTLHHAAFYFLSRNYISDLRGFSFCFFDFFPQTLNTLPCHSWRLRLNFAAVFRKAWKYEPWRQQHQKINSNNKDFYLVICEIIFLNGWWQQNLFL